MLCIKTNLNIFSRVVCIYGDLNEAHDLVKVLVYMYYIDDEVLHKVVMHFCCYLLPTKALPHDNLLSILSGVDEKGGYSTLMESLTHDEVLLLSHFSLVIY
jgi:hypothetical protein